MSRLERALTEFAAHLRDPAANPAPPGVEDRRLAIYRELFFNNVRGFMQRGFPVIRRTLGDDTLDALVRAWFAEHRAVTPYFPRMPGEFVEWLQGGPDAAADQPPWLAELAHYEWVELALELDAAEVYIPGVDAHGDLMTGVPVLSPLAWPLAYAWPVHRIGPDHRPQSPPADPTTLVVYRGRDDAVRFIETNPLTHRLLEMIAEADGRSGAELTAALGAPPDAGRQTLETLRDRAVIAGVKSDYVKSVK